MQYNNQYQNICKYSIYIFCCFMFVILYFINIINPNISCVETCIKKAHYRICNT